MSVSKMAGLILLACAVAGPVGCVHRNHAATARPVTFKGEKTNWQGYDRYALWIEGRFCMVTAPKQPRAGYPWVWRTRYPDVTEQTDKRLLDLGFHVVWGDAPYLIGAPEEIKALDALYKVLTEEYGLSRRPVFRVVSRGNISAHNWVAKNPGKVACIVGLVPVCNLWSWPGGKGVGPGDRGSWDIYLKAYGLKDDGTAAEALPGNPVNTLKALAEARVPILHVANPDDEIVPYDENTRVYAERYRALGGPIEVRIVSADLKAPAVRPGVQAFGVAGTHLAVGRAGDPDAEVEFILRHTEP